MNLTTPQVQRFWREWATTCRAMHWTRADGLSAEQIDAHRKDLLAQCGFDSLTKVDRTAGFTRVLNECIALRGESLKAAHEAVNPGLNESRILRNHILTVLIPCLELYIPDVRAYVAEALCFQEPLMRNLDLMHLDARQLKRLQFTLAARLNAKRRDSGDSIHEMRTKASMPCDCAQCRPAVPDGELVAKGQPF